MKYLKLQKRKEHRIKSFYLNSKAKCSGMFIVILSFAFSGPAIAQKIEELDYTKGYNFIETKFYNEEEDLELLKLYENLRVADVSDGMDYVGLPGTGLVDPAIHAHWKDYDSMKHIIRGIALTVRYVPTQKPAHPSDDKDFDAWVGNTYNTYTSEAFVPLIHKGTVIMIDDVEEMDIGTIGSNNILLWKSKGAVGVITDASSRDTDEVALQEIPLYLRKTGRGIRPGRNELESVNRPVSMGGVQVCPGDVVVADGDGVIVVPRKVAREVAEYARETLEKDKAGRRNLYNKLGMPEDMTVK
jgi:regulator of RNase E activity RraA